jgi:hypothetical protein
MARPIDKSVTTIPNCAEVTIQWATGSRGWMNVLHGGWTGAQAPTAALAEILFTAVKAALTSSGFAGNLHTDASVTGVKIKDLRSPNLGFVFSTSAAASGTGAGSLVSLATAIVVTQATAGSGRGFRGRSYLAGLDSDALASHITASAAADTNAAAFMEAIRTAMQANSIPMVIAQRALLAGESASGAPMGPRSATTIPVTQCRIVNSRLDSQRRRLGR